MRADSGGRAVVAETVVRQGRVRALLYQPPAAACDSRRHDAMFLVAGTPAGPGDPAEDVPAAGVRATFGWPARTYRFGGFTVAVWDVNLLTRLGLATLFRPIRTNQGQVSRRQREEKRPRPGGSAECCQSHMLEECPDAAC